MGILMWALRQCVSGAYLMIAESRHGPLRPAVAVCCRSVSPALQMYLLPPQHANVSNTPATNCSGDLSKMDTGCIGSGERYMRINDHTREDRSTLCSGSRFYAQGPISLLCFLLAT